MPQIPKQLSGWHELQKKEWVVGSAGLQGGMVVWNLKGVIYDNLCIYLYIDTFLCVQRWQCNHIVSSIYVYIHSDLKYLYIYILYLYICY